jgi:tetratricopeptide (TPR) repeat protein
VFVGFTTLRATVYVLVALVLSFVVTGAISSAYRRERLSLGESHYKRGQLLAGQGDVEAAVDQYREALLYLPNQAEFRLSLATALMSVGRLDEAQTHLQQLLQQDPTNGRINLALAHIAVQRHNPTAAIEYYQRAVYEYWPTNEIPQRRKARWELVNLLDTTGQRSAVVGELLQLYTSAPADDLGERAKIGFELIKHGAYSEAEQIFQTLERRAPQAAYGHRGLAQVNYYSGDFVSARHEFQRALRIEPNDRETTAMLALTNSVIDLDPQLPGIRSSERLRRSSNLLTRTINVLTQCWQSKIPNATAQSQLDEARAVLQKKRGADEDSLQSLQSAASRLWQNRSSFCPGDGPTDRALTSVFRRVGYEQ